MSNKKKVSIFEIVWYILTGLVAAWGISYIVVGLVHAFYPATESNNPLTEANNSMVNNFGLGFLYWGLIILAIAVVAAVVVLCIYAKSTDRELEKASRRAARLAAQVETKTPEVVDAQVEKTQAEEPQPEAKAE